MSWIRLSDGYNDDPKFDRLSDGAFRLWHQAMGFCRRFQTDGLIPVATVRSFKSYSAKRMTELLTPWHDGKNPLWHKVAGFGVKVHDYLEWNPSKDEEHERRCESKQRMRVGRERRQTPGIPPIEDQQVTDAVRANHSPPVTSEQSANHSESGSRDVPDRRGEERILLREKGSGEKPPSSLAADDVAERAGELLRHYQEWFIQHRHGARLRLIGNTLEFEESCSLVRTWTDARLEKLAVLVLTTDDPFITKTDRSFHIFAIKASWADDKLSEWERQHGVAV